MKKCRLCGKTLSEEQFAKRYDKTGKKSGTCRECRLKQNEKWRYKLLSDLRKEKGGKCEKCGWNKYIELLEFAHKDKKNKVANVTKIKNRSKAHEEAEKCLLLCPTCHTVYDYELMLEEVIS